MMRFTDNFSFSFKIGVFINLTSPITIMFLNNSCKIDTRALFLYFHTPGYNFWETVTIQNLLGKCNNNLRLKHLPNNYTYGVPYVYC